ncbi:hypothetical protein G7Y89_g15714 [Cudoniella acicularis]|uniref:Uncharacterized protein n=1 Tax=Cudoniella acicularis TaxID=354080 RepID=A0A8H4VHK0_9HELO|nr:hypothetical protein G7Y89_g15714 [Cudoniella acicularis]
MSTNNRIWIYPSIRPLRYPSMASHGRDVPSEGSAKAPNRGGRPRKHAIVEEAKEQKAAKQKQKNENLLHPADTTIDAAILLSKLSINTTVPLERTRPGSGSGSGSKSCSDDSGREPEQSPIFSDAFEHSLWCEDNSDEDRGHVVYGFRSDVDSSGDTDSGLRAAQPSSPLV